MVDIEMRELRYFRAVAETLNFTRAAERLGMTQPPLSRAIGQLERRLDVQLFRRDAREVTLTVAGQTLLEEAARVLDAVSAAARRTRRAALSTRTLLVTAKAGVATDLLRRIAEVYVAAPGGPRLTTVVSGYGEQESMVRDGRADVALLGSPHEHHGLDLVELISEPRVAALPAGHELARRPTVTCEDLAGLPMPQCPPGASAAVRDYWAGRDRTSGRIHDMPLPGPVVRDSSHLLETVALGQAVALIPISLANRNRRADITYRPVRDASAYTIAIAWPAGSRSPWIADLVRIATDLTTPDTELADIS